jgi:hypothetical protein
MLDGDLIFDDLNLYLILKPIKMKRNPILMYFCSLKKEKSKKKFLLKINKAQIFDGRFVLTDENREILRI